MTLAFDTGSQQRSNVVGAGSPWTVDRVARLVEMFHGGSSAGRIARELGGCTRNAVIGKLNRLGLRSVVRPPLTPEEQARKDERRRAQKREVDRRRSTAMRVLFSTRLPPEDLPEARQDDPTIGVSLLDLNADQCRFIRGDSRDAKPYCGQPKVSGSHYCGFHHRLIYRPAQSS